MALDYLAYNLFDNEPVDSTPSVNRRDLRDSDNPFELAATEFKKLYRLSPEMAEEIIFQLDDILKGSRITGISSEKQVLATLRFYATECYQRPVGEQWGISMSQSSVSRCIHRVTDAINNTMFPMTREERQTAKAIFASASSPFVAGTIGAIDCTHVAILTQKSHEEAYVNHHSYHSINVQKICDPNLKILNVNAKYPGARHDSYIWSSSAVRRVIQRSFENGNHNMFLIGDYGYPLEPWLMTPLPNQLEGSSKFRYNEALCKTRNPVERLFGVLKGTWRCLYKQRIRLYDPGFAGKVVNVCATLHNINLHNQSYETEFETSVTHTSRDLVDQNLPSSIAKRVQDRLIANYFT
ncbi:putative nuclease HARBI1 [Calliphora vicina]|uniref:putative nuclease HARBI1 n=1 Tax=Calliphora vicina TaxID=7373 RepID=UPI00325A58CC